MPHSEHWHGLSVFGSVTRTVADTALWLDVVAGRAQGDAEAARTPETSFAEAATRSPGKLRIAVSFAMGPPPVKIKPDVRQAVEQTADLLRSLGHTVEPKDPSYGLVQPVFIPRWLHGIHEDAAALPHPERLERRIKQLAAAGRLIGRGGAVRSRAAEPAYTARLAEVFRDYDVLLTPTMPTPPWPLLRFEGRSVVRATLGAADIVPFTTPWNVTGQPAASLPAGFTDGGLPLAVQLVGRPHDETTLLSLAAQLESERPWGEQRPAVASS
jgi:amidase